MKSIADEIEELRAMTVAELVPRYEDAFRKPPRVKHREWLWKRIAWKIQEQRFGGLSNAAKRQIDELIAEMDLPLGEDRRTVTGRLRGDAKAAGPASCFEVSIWLRSVPVKQSRYFLMMPSREYSDMARTHSSGVAKRPASSFWQAAHNNKTGEMAQRYKFFFFMLYCRLTFCFK